MKGSDESDNSLRRFLAGGIAELLMLFYVGGKVPKSWSVVGNLLKEMICGDNQTVGARLLSRCVVSVHSYE